MKRAELAPVDRMGEYRLDTILPLPWALFTAAEHLIWIPVRGDVLVGVRRGVDNTRREV